MHLARRLLDELIAHVEAVAPAEGCGLLAMDAGGSVRRVYAIDNVADSSVRFTADPDGHFAALVDAEAHGWHIGGVFHSHPRSSAVPSRTDVAGALDPDWVYVIVGLAGITPEVRAWWIRHGRCSEEPVTTSEDRVPCR